MAEGSDAITGKFDFYDILGYLVPGLVLLGLLSVPFGLISGRWPSTSITTAVLYLLCAHILGHILQGFLRAWEKAPQIRDKRGKLRLPSSVLLDADQALALFRTKIGELVNRFWQIPAADFLADNHDSDRNAAFLQARNLLLQSKRQSYFEQFQGKYALMGGVAAGLTLASAYYAGWGVGLIPSDCIAQWAIAGSYVLGAVLIVLLVCFVLNQRFDSGALLHVVLVLLLFGTFLVGFVSGGNSGESNLSRAFQIEHKATFMLILALAAFAAAIRCYGSYKAFANEFAMGVWRDFANFDLITKSDDK